MDDGADAEPYLRNATVLDVHCTSSHREGVVAATLRELLEGEAPTVAENRPDGLDDELAGRERRREVQDEEVVRSDLAAAARRLRDDVAAEHEQAERQLRGRVRMHDRAGDGAAVPGNGVADVRECLGDERQARGLGRPFELALPHESAEAESPVVALDAVETRHTVQVDEDGRAEEPHVQHGHEALPAGERFRLVAVLGEGRERLVERRGAHEVKGGGLHPCNSSQTRPGVSGSSSASIPSASATAFAIAAGTLIVVPSPRPFAPSVVKGDGVSWWALVNGGRSGAVGQR